MLADKKPPDRGNYLKRRTFQKGFAEVHAAHLSTFRLYCDSLNLWRRCKKRSCLRHRRCLGDTPGDCFCRALPFVPPARRIVARKAVIKGGPRRISPATHIEWFVRRLDLIELMKWTFG